MSIMNVVNIHRDCLKETFQYLDEQSLHSVSMVCKYFKQLSEDNSLWKKSIKKYRITCNSSNNISCKKIVLEYAKKYCSFFHKITNSYMELPKNMNVFLAKNHISNCLIENKLLKYKFDHFWTLKPDQVSMLIEAGFEFNEYNLNVAIAQSSNNKDMKDIIRLLLDAGIKPTKKTQELMRIYCESAEIIKLINDKLASMPT